MDDLDRLFRHLVTVLAAERPERLETAFQVSELYQSLLPYRRCRRELGLTSIEDYEMTLLRLLAGERGYATVQPGEAQQALALEAGAANPNTGAFRDFAAARVRLDPTAVERVLGERPAYAPPPPSPSQEEEQKGRRGQGEQIAQAVDVAPVVRCTDCGAELPQHRAVIFCPHCGRQLAAAPCRQCGEETEPGWRFCPTCGHPVTG